MLNLTGGCSPKIATLCFILFFSQLLLAQPKKVKYKKSKLQLGLFPGLSTNGIHPGKFDNHFSFNLFTGYGHSTKYLEINGLAGFNTYASSGIHISGLANFLGGNGQAGLTRKQIREQYRQGYEANLSGIQVAGIINYVIKNTFGAQAALGINITGGYLLGSQFSGLVNYVEKFTIGTQVSVLANFSKRSMTGVQLAVLLNTTQGRYAGIQIGAFNHAGVIGNLKGPSPDLGTAWQVGLINTAGNMGGWQMGLLNIGQRVTGTQIGLVNVFKGGKSMDYPDGPAFGLLNFGYYANPRVYLTELFATNYGWVTGKPFNARVRAASRTVYSYNELVFSTNYQRATDIYWGISYRAGIISFSRSLTGGISHYFSFMAEAGHVNWRQQTDRGINMRYSLLMEAGIRLAKKLAFIYPFIGLSYNYMPETPGNTPEFLASTVGDGRLWPGYTVGFMFH